MYGRYKCCDMYNGHEHCNLIHPLNEMSIVKISKESHGQAVMLNISPVEWFSENIRRHLLCWAEVDFNLLLFYLLPDPMHLDVYMLHFAMCSGF